MNETREPPVVGIHSGILVPHGNTPDEPTVTLLENLLEEARSGHVVGVAIAAQESTGHGKFNYSGSFGYSLLGALSRLNHRLNIELEK
jgi:hypothetical protein